MTCIQYSISLRVIAMESKGKSARMSKISRTNHMNKVFKTLSLELLWERNYFGNAIVNLNLNSVVYGLDTLYKKTMFNSFRRFIPKNGLFKPFNLMQNR